jgi:4-amino-4-deoxy-L-arabinose transferase-like glycosyltransferase
MNVVNPDRRGARWDRACVTLLALSSCAVGLLNDFVYDDVPLIRDNVRIHSLANWRDLLTLPYWPPPYAQDLYRPLAVMFFAVEYALGGGSPIAYRLVSYALYAACTIGVYVLASRLLSRRAALLATALFAAHPVHVEAVALGVNQGELVVGLAAVAMVLVYLDGRRGGGISARRWAVLYSVFAAAALTKENAFVIPAIMVAAESILIDDGPWRARVERLFGGYAALAAIGAIIIAIRGIVLVGRVAGATPNMALAGLGVFGRMFTMLQVVPQWARLLLWPARLQADFVPADFPMPSGMGPPELLGLGLIVVTLALIVYNRRRAPVLSFGLTWCLVALLPVSNIVPTSIMLAERTLFLPSVGLILAIGAAGEKAVALTGRQQTTMRLVLMSACAILVVAGLVHSGNRHHSWNSAHVQIANPTTTPEK